MSTTTWNNLSENGNSNNNPIIITVPIILIIGLILGIVWYYIGLQTTYATNEKYIVEDTLILTPSQIRIIEIISGHAWQKHGYSQVSKAFECLGKYGSTKAFKTIGFKGKFNEDIPTNLWMCYDKETGDWYTVVTTIFEKIHGNKVARLVTAYKLAFDIFPTIDDYIDYLTTKWGAVAINYMLNAEKIFLQPK